MYVMLNLFAFFQYVVALFKSFKLVFFQLLLFSDFFRVCTLIPYWSDRFLYFLFEVLSGFIFYILKLCYLLLINLQQQKCHCKGKPLPQEVNLCHQGCSSIFCLASLILLGFMSLIFSIQLLYDFPNVRVFALSLVASLLLDFPFAMFQRTI